MVDLKNYISDDYLSVARVKEAKHDTAVLLDEGKLETYEGKDSFKVLIDFDGERLYWRVNKTTLKAFVKTWGTNTKNHVGRKVSISIGNVKGNDAIIGTPLQE